MVQKSYPRVLFLLGPIWTKSTVQNDCSINLNKNKMNYKFMSLRFMKLFKIGCDILCMIDPVVYVKYWISKIEIFQIDGGRWAGCCWFYSRSWRLLDRNTHWWKLHGQSKQWYTQCTVYPSSRFDHVICKYLSRSPSSSSNYIPTEDR